MGPLVCVGARVVGAGVVRIEAEADDGGAVLDGAFSSQQPHSTPGLVHEVALGVCVTAEGMEGVVVMLVWRGWDEVDGGTGDGSRQLPNQP